ncbi:hypothetical protein GCM10023080_013500 [Streptomyces pseudoechinosporeus]
MAAGARADEYGELSDAAGVGRLCGTPLQHFLGAAPLDPAGGCAPQTPIGLNASSSNAGRAEISPSGV